MGAALSQKPHGYCGQCGLMSTWSPNGKEIRSLFLHLFFFFLFLLKKGLGVVVGRGFVFKWASALKFNPMDRVFIWALAEDKRGRQ